MHTAYSPNVAGDSAAVLNGRHLDLAIFQTALLKIPLLNFQVFSCVMAFKAILFFTLLILEKNAPANVHLVATVSHIAEKKIEKQEKKRKEPEKV